jgi:hypothetical protein
MLRDQLRCAAPSALLRRPSAGQGTHEWGFCRTRQWRSRPLLAFGRIPHKGLGFLARLAEGEGRGAYGTRNKPANTHSERHDWTL